MVNPSLSNLMNKENINRYTLVIATAKAARNITDEYIAQRDFVEKNPGNASPAPVNEKYRDEKAVQNAIEELYDGEYKLVQETLPYNQGTGTVAEKSAEDTECAEDAETAETAEDAE